MLQVREAYELRILQARWQVALTPAQQKLVTIYINRAMEKNGGAGAKRVGADGRVPLAPRMN